MWLDQTFAFSDLPKVLLLSFLEIALSADNALIISIFTLNLAPHLRRKALLVGLVSAFILRAAALVFLSFFFQSFWIRFLGSLYLMYVAIDHFIKKRNKTVSFPQSSPYAFWKTVFLIECFDFVFAIDSLLAAFAFIGSDTYHTIHPKLWIVYLGGMIGVGGMRYAAHIFTHLIEKFPRFASSAYCMIGWTGLKLGMLSFQIDFSHKELIFWMGIALFTFYGFYNPLKKNKN